MKGAGPSVVIPTLDEADRLPGLLEALRFAAVGEVVVSDGGSRDDTVAVARRHGATVVEGPPGRGPQLDRGARATQGEVLWFLHADTWPPPDAVARIREALADPAVMGGAFVRHTVSDRRHGGLGVLLRVFDLSSAVGRSAYGDQGIFVRRTAWEAVGGFGDAPILEDHAFTRRLARRGRWVRVWRPIRVSGRRFEARPLYYIAVMSTFPALHRAGVSAHTLARWYRHERGGDPEAVARAGRRTLTPRRWGRRRGRR